MAGLLTLALAGATGELRAQTGGAEGSGEVAFDSFSEAADYAENAWIFGDYAMVVDTLATLILPNAPPDADLDLLERSYGRLGASAFFGGNTELASQSFLALLLLAPRTELDRLVYPAQVIRVFEQVRVDNAALLAPLLGETSSGDGAVYIERTVHEQSILVSMLPFGYGLFAADRPGPASGYLVGQLATGLTSASLFIANEAARGADGTFARPGAARTRQQVQITSGWLFVSLVAANALHGALVHERTRTIEYIRLDGPPDDLQSRDSSRRWHVRIVPILPGFASID
jgi:hypothetical protein